MEREKPVRPAAQWQWEAPLSTAALFTRHDEGAVRALGDSKVENARSRGQSSVLPSVFPVCALDTPRIRTSITSVPTFRRSLGFAGHAAAMSLAEASIPASLASYTCIGIRCNCRQRTCNRPDTTETQHPETCNEGPCE